MRRVNSLSSFDMNTMLIWILANNSKQCVFVNTSEKMWSHRQNNRLFIVAFILFAFLPTMRMNHVDWFGCGCFVAERTHTYAHAHFCVSWHFVHSMNSILYVGKSTCQLVFCHRHTYTHVHCTPYRHTHTHTRKRPNLHYTIIPTVYSAAIDVSDSLKRGEPNPNSTDTQSLSLFFFPLISTIYSYYNRTKISPKIRKLDRDKSNG